MSQIKKKLPTMKFSKANENKSNDQTPERSEENMGEVFCFHHHQHQHIDQFRPKYGVTTKDKRSVDAAFYTAGNSPEVNFIPPFSAQGKAESFLKNVSEPSGSWRRAESSSNEMQESESNKCSDCSNSEKHGNPKIRIKSGGSEQEIGNRNLFPQKPSVEESSRKLQVGTSGKTREKLVYVVEEDGQNATKLETDLFTLNEILAIKKDLVELSEFAKKLKKLKEIKKENDKTKKNGSCECRPAAELLKDVNKRIEVLEARQEELENCEC